MQNSSRTEQRSFSPLKGKMRREITPPRPLLFTAARLRGRILISPLSPTVGRAVFGQPNRPTRQRAAEKSQ